jgi:hypothetical protein
MFHKNKFSMFRKIKLSILARHTSRLAAVVALLGMAAPVLAVNYFDSFDRPDNAVLGDGWIEKSPGAFSILNAAAGKNQISTGYRDNIVYRPTSEDLLDAEASLEIRLLNNAIGYPQVFVRVQADSVATANTLDGYILYMDNSLDRAVLGRQRGSAFVTPLATVFLTAPMNTTDVYRLRLRAEGANPVALDAWVERQNGTAWDILGQASVVDAAANRVATPGAVGFGGYVESTYAFDNFNRLDLQLGGADNPLPATTAVSPDNIDEGSAAFSLTVTGTDFVPGAIVRWNGADRNTTFVSSTELQAAVTAADVAVAGTANVTVFNPLPGGGLSNAQLFTTNAIPGNPVPAITGIDPDTAAAGSQGFTLVVNGAGFVPESVIRWNGGDRQTNFVSSTELQAVIPAADVAVAGNAEVSVFSPGPGGGLSNLQTFTVIDPLVNPIPGLVSMTPNLAIEGSAGFTLVLNGQDFVPDSVVRWDGSDRPTTFISATQLEATIDAADISADGVVNVSVFTPAPGGGLSTSLVFTIEPAGGGGPGQSLIRIDPISAPAGGASFTMTLDGFGFTQNSVAQFGGIPLATTYVSDTQLLATVDSGLLAVGLRSAITVLTPEADNPITAPQTLFVLEPGEAVAFDNFNRADNPDLGNEWTEKTPSVFALEDGEVSGGRTESLGFNHVITYRPEAEDAQNVEVGMEFVRTPGSPSLYPQVHARVQRSTVTEPGLLTSYTLFFDSYTSSGQIHITPIENWYECYIATWDLTTPFVEGERYRLRFRVIGTNPVQMTGFMERFNVDYWEVVAAGSVLHDQNSPPTGFCNSNGMIPPIEQSGSTGFAKWRDASDRYDNFYTIRLAAENNPAPVTTSLTPSTAQQGGGDFDLVVRGVDFAPNAVVRWNGAERPTTFVSTTELRASISAVDIAAAGAVDVSVFNPAPGGGLSNAQTFIVEAPIGNPLPALSSLSPELVVVDGAGFTLDIVGSGFIPGSVVRWNGADRATTYVSATQLQAAIEAADIANAGAAAVTVFNPAPGGGVSNDLTVTILDPGTDYFDDFGRPDGALLGDGWIEKQPGAFSLAGGVALKGQVGSGYRDNIVYRPSAEDLLDVEASVEFNMQSVAVVGYPQLFVRVQSDTVETANGLDAYILYMDNSTSRANLGRQRGTAFEQTLTSLFLTTPLNATDQFRLRLRATGTNPVVLDAFVERLGTAGWETIGTASVTDTAANRLDTAGSVGFGGHTESNYSYDNFTRLYLGP